MPRKLSLKVLASIAALSLFGAVGAWGTYSAFTDTTQSSGSTFSSGTVHITDDDAGSAMFALTGMVPGSQAIKCINVTNSGDVAFSNVALSAAKLGLAGRSAAGHHRQGHRRHRWCQFELRKLQRHQHRRGLRAAQRVARERLAV